ncbi:MAG: glycosyltransferase family 2 protein [Opitutales bacterium]|nr:glycosyltransferase family 2 protein [Opitutales bacterium]
MNTEPSDDPPFFSVVIPTYNRCEMLRAALASVRNQTFADYEVIVVDSLSDDGTEEMMAGLEQPIRYIREKNGGPGPARNIGIAAAKGTYIAFLDSDDLWFPWTLETYHAVIQKENSPAFLTGKPRIFEDEKDLDDVEQGTPQLRSDKTGIEERTNGIMRSKEPHSCEPATYPSAIQDKPSYNAFADYLASGDAWRWFGVSSFVVRADALRAAGGFDPRGLNAEDADLALRLGTAPGFVELTAPVQFAYRAHDANLTKNETQNLAGLRAILDRESAGEFPGGNARRRERRRIITRHLRPVALACLRARQFADAWNLYAASFLWHMAEARFRFIAAFPLRFAAALATGRS